MKTEAVAPARRSGRPVCLCGAEDFNAAFSYSEKPASEVRFRFSSGRPYRREVLKCGACGHFVSVHSMDMGALYEGDYADSNYAAGIRQAYDRILALPSSQSDNAGRVRRFLEFAGAHFARARAAETPRTFLDVGCGLGVFLDRMKEAGWDGTGVDADGRFVGHARNVVGVKAVRADFNAARKTARLGRFDAVVFNKVLEHASDPVSMLARSREHLRVSGFVYAELPDGEAASAHGQDREEFTIDHPHVFSPASAGVLVRRAGLKPAAIERLHEPSGKFTIRVFMTP